MSTETIYRARVTWPPSTGELPMRDETDLERTVRTFPITRLLQPCEEDACTPPPGH
jgi:hypothetical protein